jgi:formylglycine-generating enzyme required for sulfatase activity
MVAAGAGAFWYLRAGSTAPSVSTANTGLESNAAYRLVTAFTQDADWSDARLIALNTDLSTVGDDVLATAGDSTAYQHFVDDVRRRFKEQQALSARPLVPENSPIAALAVTVGLDLHSPDSAVHIAPVVDRVAASETRVRETMRPAASTTAARPITQHTPTGSAHTEPETTPAVKATTAPSAAVVPAPAASTNSVQSSRRSTAPPPASAPAATAHTQMPVAAAASGGEPCTAALAATRRPRCQDAFKAGGGLGPMMAVVPAGAFEMGNAAEEAERPVHHVTISTPFAMSTYEVSQQEYRTFCERSGRTMPAQPWSGDDYPVVKVSWNDAQEYVRWLSAATGEHYRLPTEAEWEYAARAGVTGLFPSGDTLSPTDAWFSTAKQRLDMPARRNQQFNRNKFQLFHMVGNVREWVQDSWVAQYDGAPTDGSARTTSGEARVVRGGAYVDSATTLRLTTRENLATSASDTLTGIRVVRDVH